MSLPRPSGLKTPGGSKLARPGGAPQKSGLMMPGTLAKAQSAIAKSARAAGLNSSTAERYAADTVHALAGEEDLNAPPPPVDDFIIGDRVFVSGSKPGYIAFLGETQFAPGEWAGVVLDEFIGKNDGAVNGVKYFQCEAKRGVFCRISKLSRTPGLPATQKSEDTLSEASMPMNGGDHNNVPSRRPTTPSLQHRPVTPSRLARPTTPSLPRPVHKSLSSSNTSINKGHAPVKNIKAEITATPSASSAASSGSGVKHNLNIGDRVLVSGSKPGTLRYVGPADFAKGQWAGIELDDPLGKNDGAVAGKRYFDCRPRYGLFAPVHKVMKTLAGSMSTPSPMTRSLGSTSGLRLSRERSGSQESVSSISSATSSASRPRVRLGVSGLGNSQGGASTGRAGQRPSTLNITATTAALQKALKEKEEHIEQLLRERDLERSEVARAAAQVDEAQDQLTHIRVEKERHLEESEENIQQLLARIQKLGADKKDLEDKLEDEKRKVEDLQFQIEEEVISKDDLESRTEEEEAKIRELEKTLKKEKERSEKLENDFLTAKTTVERQTGQLKSMEETQTSYLDQVEELTHKLSQAENKIGVFDSSRLEEGAKTSQVGLELAEKSNRVSELEDCLSFKDKEVKQLQDKLAEMKDELVSRSAKQEKLQLAFEEVTDKLKANEVFSNDLSTQLQNLKDQHADIQRQLVSSQDRNQQLTSEKTQLEGQIGDMMKNTGDSSNQLSMLNDQLGQKNRKLEELQADLSTSTQKWHNLNNQHESSMREKEREIESINSKHDTYISTLTTYIEDVQKELDKTKSKTISMEKDFESEKETLIKRKESEISDLKQQVELAKENLSKQEIQTQAHKQVLDNITMEKEAVQFEREKLEKQLKRHESERDSLNNELIKLKVEMTKNQSSQEQTTVEKFTLEEKIQDITEDKERLEKNIAELQKGKDDLQTEREKLSGERDKFQGEVMEGRASIQQKDMLLEELHKEVERLKGETTHLQENITQLSQQSSDSSVVQSQLNEQRSLVESLRKQLGEKDTAAHTLQQKLDDHDFSVKEAKIELEESQETVSLLEENVKELETERDSLKSQLQTALDARQEHAKLMELNQDLNSEIETMKARHRKETELLQTTHTSLQQEVDNSGALLIQRDQDITSKLSQITNLENENSMLIGYKASNEKLERDTADLHDQINKLQSKLLEAQSKAKIESQSIANVNNNIESTPNGTNIVVDKLKEENEAAQHQVTPPSPTTPSRKPSLFKKVKRREIIGTVEFLNSVIVDLQHKNDELKTRLEVMETGGVTNGNSDMDDITPTRRAPPRVFCDICDEFDRHETEDCPLQEMSDSPPPSQFHGDRKQVRPYCDICEEFHEPCSALSIRTVSQSEETIPIDPETLVHDWVKRVDTVTSELAIESEKVFGDDMEFFHVQRDPSDVPGFRDSGYYDGVVDNKLPFDSKQGVETIVKKGLEANVGVNYDIKAAGDTGNKFMAGVDCIGLGSVSDKSSKTLVITQKNDKKDFDNSTVETNIDKAVTAYKKDKKKSEIVVANRPDVLETSKTTAQNDLTNPSNSQNIQSPFVETPSSMSRGSDSEYVSGIESLSSDPDTPPGMELDSPSGMVGTSDMETSVDTGEVFQKESPTEENKTTDVDKAAENCVVS